MALRTMVQTRPIPQALEVDTVKSLLLTSLAHL